MKTDVQKDTKLRKFIKKIIEIIRIIFKNG